MHRQILRYNYSTHRAILMINVGLAQAHLN